MGDTQALYLSVLEEQPYGARLLELRNGAPAFTEAARLACEEGVECAGLDLNSARVDVLSSAWAVAVGLLPTGSPGARRLTPWVRLNGAWRAGAAAAVPATELAGVQATPPYPYLFTIAAKDLGVRSSSGASYAAG